MMMPVRAGSPTSARPQPAKNATQTCYHDSPFLENDPATQNVLVILNSPIRNPPSLLFQRLWDSASFRVCADGGANRLHDASKEYIPNAIRGDLDSLRQDVRSYYEERGVSVEQDSDQNTNDLDKALQFLHSKRDEIWQTDEDTWTGRVCIYGAFGGRFDQEMGCIQALFKWSDTFHNKLFLVDDSTCAFFLPAVVRNEIRLPFYGEKSSPPANENVHPVGEGPTCGLIPIGHRCEFAHTTGLKWNLNGDVALEFGGMVSTSNRAVDEVVTVQASHPLVFTAEMTAGNGDNDT
jgi:thiamine pyrophosphokinase